MQEASFPNYTVDNEGCSCSPESFYCLYCWDMAFRHISSRNLNWKLCSSQAWTVVVFLCTFTPHMGNFVEGLSSSVYINIVFQFCTAPHQHQFLFLIISVLYNRICHLIFFQFCTSCNKDHPCFCRLCNILQNFHCPKLYSPLTSQIPIVMPLW